MTHRIRTTAIIAAATLYLGTMPGRGLQAQDAPAQGPEQLVAAIKQSLAQSQKQIRQYEWIETTAISLKGEEKARKQQRAYYGADGKLTKVPMGDQPPAQAEQDGGRRGGRGGGRAKERIVENKKDEMQEYMEQAVALVHKYVPPDPALIQAAKDKGKMSSQPGAAGQTTLAFADYLLPGDRLGIGIDAKAARLSGLNVATYLDKPEDKVTLDVTMGALTDGTVYNQRVTFDAAAKNIKVVIENSGHRPLAK